MLWRTLPVIGSDVEGGAAGGAGWVDLAANAPGIGVSYESARRRQAEGAGAEQGSELAINKHPIRLQMGWLGIVPLVAGRPGSNDIAPATPRALNSA